MLQSYEETSIECLKLRILNHLLFLEDIATKFISEEIKNTLDLETMREDIEVEVGVLLNENTTMGYRRLNDLLSSVINKYDINYEQ